MSKRIAKAQITHKPQKIRSAKKKIVDGLDLSLSVLEHEILQYLHTCLSRPKRCRRDDNDLPYWHTSNRQLTITLQKKRQLYPSYDTRAITEDRVRRALARLKKLELVMISARCWVDGFFGVRIQIVPDLIKHVLQRSRNDLKFSSKPTDIQIQKCRKESLKIAQKCRKESSAPPYISQKGIVLFSEPDSNPGQFAGENSIQDQAGRKCNLQEFEYLVDAGILTECQLKSLASTATEYQIGRAVEVMWESKRPVEHAFRFMTKAIHENWQTRSDKHKIIKANGGRLKKNTPQNRENIMQGQVTLADGSTLGKDIYWRWAVTTKFTAAEIEHAWDVLKSGANRVWNWQTFSISIMEKHSNNRK